MKKYNTPDLEIVNYDIKDCLSTSGTPYTTNGEQNVEFDLPDWNDDVI